MVMLWTNSSLLVSPLSISDMVQKTITIVVPIVRIKSDPFGHYFGSIVTIKMCIGAFWL